jgi:XTP/dITP diphosphohydrolase
MKIVLATHNRDKVREIRSMLRGMDVEVLTVDDFPGVPDPVEDGDTLEANALKKAREIRDHTGVSALADDTGLEVDALGGAPGVESARFASVTDANASYDANCEKLLRELNGVPEEKRGARFRTAMALALTADERERLHAALDARPHRREELGSTGDAPDILIAEGIIEGTITPERRGDGGFGYDPVFYEPRRQKTLAEMTAEEKNQTSHRYRALVEMRELILRLELARENGGDV